MKTKKFINIAVNNEFNTTYTRNLVKCYLYKALLINPYTKNPYNNHQIALMLGLDRQKVGDYLFQMSVFLSRQDNPFLKTGFTEKFNNVKLACEANAKSEMIQVGRESLNRAEKSLNRAKLSVISNYQLN